jgi:PAS domain S-box-containing protein
VAVFAFDRDLRFELASGAAVAETGWRPEEILGRTLAELVPPERFGSYAAPYRAALAGERRSFEVQGWRDPGKAWAIDVVPIRGADGAVTGGMVFGTEVSERRRAERELGPGLLSYGAGAAATVTVPSAATVTWSPVATAPPAASGSTRTGQVRP